MFEDNQQLDTSWYIFREQATDAVRRGHEPEHTSGYVDYLELQLLTLPSFEPTIGWQIYRRQPMFYIKHPVENAGLPRFIATRTMWMHQADLEKFYAPLKRLEYLNRLYPSLSFQVVEVEPQRIQEEIKKLHTLVIPPFLANNFVGLDGVSFEISQGNSMAGVRLNWWDEGPKEWLPLQEVFVSLWATLEELTIND